MATDDDVAAIAAELFAAPFGDFTAARTAQVKAARDAGDRDLAARIGALPKPSAAAWLIDLLAREHTDDLDRVDDLGGRLRAAQEDPDRALLRELGAERRALLAEIADIAATRSEEAGRHASAAVLEEVQQTLQAAMSDDHAAAAVRSGRLIRSLAAEGLDPVDLTNAVAVGGRLQPITRTKRTAGKATPAEAERDAEADAAAERREQAEQRAADAARAAEDAKQDADDLAAEADDAESTAQQHAEAADDLRTELERLQQRLEEAEAALVAAQEAAATARRAADDAASAADDAQRDADDAAEAVRRLP